MHTIHEEICEILEAKQFKQNNRVHSKESEHESTCLLVNDTVPCGGCCMAVILYCMQCDSQSDCYF